MCITLIGSGGWNFGKSVSRTNIPGHSRIMHARATTPGFLAGFGSSVCSLTASLGAFTVFRPSILSFASTAKEMRKNKKKVRRVMLASGTKHKVWVSLLIL